MNTSATGAPKRPTFLTVLCILSFIGCGLGLFSGISGYFTAKAMDNGSMGKMMEGLSEAAGDAAAADSMQDGMADVDKAMDALGMDFGAMANNSLAQGLLCIVVLIGVFMMWKLKKTGFYVYTASNLAYAACPFIFMGGLAGGMMGILGAIGPILFIILYGLNVKHMS
ncbi:MAG: hypothetical protein ABI599_15750 [Flavobacteriales bacterium]